ncbi:MAG: amidohydrolase [Zymomonas mobilis subsp. pomaceae]|uniref:Amidohydrolase 3 n=1 Tax=Zymomonas mobilis subsp. pomaceae (strain ATCC 29192 / DSM 22645 / JCM 10191 / CCUG 17912 / NBRC 13757 / NCIMB 11200 / NRRL B-4491 / Barker I) TaxID=579138 RepID=F8ET66_ZYMMT|nr:amidohydrolase [Zymomonas mobilis]AEI36956.1 Amidohydrolase 3 [Zymomonas mobilis subsp. pomaceae ATCC 29192]MDX5948329.1 amidohydrolase [Zymomonas mobilis subsp. pomaceae]GEB89085.1 amidohydrolase [Zymomonas mobilis subsp. pomaceae]
MKIVKTLAFVASISAFYAFPLKADGLIDHINGITLDTKGNLHRFTSLLIGRDGKVVKLLNKNDKKPSDVDFYLNGKDQTLIPGFVDGHTHVMALGERGIALDLSDTESLQQAQDKMRHFAEEHPTARWILGGGWNEEKWHLGRQPQASDIDKAINDRPVWLLRSDGHVGLANSLALDAAHITNQTAALIKEGHVGYTTNHRLSGLLTDQAMTLVARVIPPLQPVDRDAAFTKAQQIFFSRGITTATDMGTSIDDWNVMRRMGDLGHLRLRIRAYADGLDPLLSIAGKYPTLQLYNGRLSMGGVNFSMDGSVASYGAWLKQDYADTVGRHGIDTVNDAKLRNLMSRAAMDGFQVAVHAAGDAANDQLLNAIDELSQSYTGDRRWRVEDATVIDIAEINRYSKYDLVVSMQPANYFSDKTTISTRLGTSRMQNGSVEAWKNLADHDVHLAFGEDFPATETTPFMTIADILNRHDDKGSPEQPLKKEAAFSAYSIDAAYAAFSEKQIGQLMPGYYADFILIDRDPFVVDTESLRHTRILETWVAGQQVWSQD